MVSLRRVLIFLARGEVCKILEVGKSTILEIHYGSQKFFEQSFSFKIFQASFSSKFFKQSFQAKFSSKVFKQSFLRQSFF